MRQKRRGDVAFRLIAILCCGLAAVGAGCGSRSIPIPASVETGNDSSARQSDREELPRRTQKDAAYEVRCGSAGPRPKVEIGPRPGKSKGFPEDGSSAAACEASISWGLKWLAAHQSAQGNWGLERFPQDARCECTGRGLDSNDIAGTAVALLAFLGAGQVHRSSDNAKNLYSREVDRGLQYLLLKQDAHGFFECDMLAQALATMAISEAYGLTSDAALKAPAQRSLNYLIKAQRLCGGWRRSAEEQENTVLTAWALLALKAGEAARLEVPESPQDEIMSFLDSVATIDGDRYGYTGVPLEGAKNGSGDTASAGACLCRLYLGWSPQHMCLRKSVVRLLKVRPSLDIPDLSYYFLATQVMYHFNERLAWDLWNPSMRDVLLKSQDKGERVAHQKGSWFMTDALFSRTGGRVASTSLAILILESSHRQSPLYSSVQLK